MLKTAVSDI